MRGFESEFEAFLLQQQRGAKGQRLEMLKKDMTGTKKLLEVAVWPVLKSFEGLVLEHEMVSQTGVRIYGDVFISQANCISETEGFAVHAEMITRDRFSFEKMRIRTIALLGYGFLPFSWDELDKRGDLCRRAIYELFGRTVAPMVGMNREITVYEREVLRYVSRLNRPFRLEDVCRCLGMTEKPCRTIIRKLVDMKLVKPIGQGSRRIHYYVLEEGAFRHF
ncbi:hypothetical protein [Cohnella candidum]|uniref:Uncharacterized protein n=1 Tax=Cohnella candidum TaxID=2674991 RepID=A0A3G3K130_9BACL|nr:hypothetical protein [Cohnella candidum]AYQ74090.1 hypothetical protein EAV92_16895 [Cohnella candidum]